MQRQKKQNGFGLVEIILGGAILSFILFSLSSFLVLAQRVHDRTDHVVRANYLMLEAIDAARILRDNSWSASIGTLAVGTPYYFVWDSSSWVPTTTPTLIDGTYDRTITFGNVLRDVNDNIATAGILDTGTRSVSVHVAWKDLQGTSSRQFDTYITDLFDN